MTDRRIPAATIRRAWADTSNPVPVVAASIGLSHQALQRRAKAMGLPRRKCGWPPKISPGNAEFRSMWLAGVNRDGIAAHFGCDVKSVSNAVRRDGLPRRNGSGRASITLEQHQRALVIEAMARQAVMERNQFIIAEMVDGRTDQRRGMAA